jgi:hypothetical protein
VCGKGLLFCHVINRANPGVARFMVQHLMKAANQICGIVGVRFPRWLRDLSYRNYSSLFACPLWFRRISSHLIPFSECFGAICIACEYI